MFPRLRKWKFPRRSYFMLDFRPPRTSFFEENAEISISPRIFSRWVQSTNIRYFIASIQYSQALHLWRFWRWWTRQWLRTRSCKSGLKRKIAISCEKNYSWNLFLFTDNFPFGLEVNDECSSKDANRLDEISDDVEHSGADVHVISDGGLVCVVFLAQFNVSLILVIWRVAVAVTVTTMSMA